jgi:hypothetical protein
MIFPLAAAGGIRYKHRQGAENILPTRAAAAPGLARQRSRIADNLPDSGRPRKPRRLR